MRKLDGKYHITNDEIVNTSTGAVIPEDEPLFLFRARDILALGILVTYGERCLINGCTNKQIEGVAREIKKFQNFIKQHHERMKQPGKKDGAG